MFDTFIDDARRHFAREEKILHDAGYPRTVEHCVYHWRLLQRAHSVQGMCRDGDDQIDIRTCFDKMVSFFFDDTMRADMDFLPFLREKGLIDPQMG